MSSLRDALRQAGLSESKKRDKRAKPRRGQGGAKRQPTATAEVDLAEAYRARRLAEKQETAQKKQAKLAAQEARRQRNLALEAILKDQSLNAADADVARFFEYGGRIRRVLCTAEQRNKLNAGELAVVMFRGRALLVTPIIAQQVAALAADAVPDLTSDEPSQDKDEDEGYPPVPDDLIW